MEKRSSLARGKERTMPSQGQEATGFERWRRERAVQEKATITDQKTW